jgi:ApbE superfamily uncharacterized protein (UPF0280 family)
LHLSDGPIDLVIGADGAEGAVRAACEAATLRFATILEELCAELPLLRRHADPGEPPAGAVARCMWRAVLPHAARGFITPMAAVAGAVADAILAAMTRAAPLDRAHVNNGGDIALHLAPGASATAGLIDRPDRPALAGIATIRAEDGVRGIATSGWRGRSFSLGIADAVTILAADAATADAAATIVANAVDLPGHPSVLRRPARELQPDSDLGARAVTVAVGELTADEIGAALERGVEVARALSGAGRIAGAVLRLAGETRVLPLGVRQRAVLTPVPVGSGEWVGSCRAEGSARVP